MASSTYRLIRRGLDLFVRAFFRELHVTGAQRVPTDRGGLLVSWHPNGLIDPGLVFTALPQPVVFGARHGLFRYPLLGTLLRQLGTVPIYRAMDGGRDPARRREANERSLQVLAERIAAGSYSALFPEGDSHDESDLRTLKTGAARLYYRARSLRAPGTPPPVIIPVGLHYDDKNAFRSSALVAFHSPLELPAELDQDPDPQQSEANETRARALTEHIEQALREVVHATEDWTLHHTLHRVRRLVRAEQALRTGNTPGRTTIGERVLGFAQVRTAYYAARARDPARVATLRRRVRAYDRGLRALRLEDYDLDRDPRLSPWLAVLSVAQALLVVLLLPPIVLLGYVINLPTSLLLMGLARAASRKEKDEATVKLLAGAILYPLTWIAAGIAGGLGHVALNQAFPRLPNTPITVGVSIAVLGAVGGAIALRYSTLTRQTARSIRVRITRRRQRAALAHLRVERAELYDEAVALVDALMDGATPAAER